MACVVVDLWYNFLDADMLILAYVMPWCFIYRKQVLATRGQGPEDFKSPEDAWKAADALIAELHANHPEMPRANPAKLCPGVPQLDLFWFAVFSGQDVHIYIYIYRYNTYMNMDIEICISKALLVYLSMSVYIYIYICIYIYIYI